jgi:hypothetical protein
VLDWLICESFVEPKVSLGRKAGCMPIAKLSKRDKEVVALTLGLQGYAGTLK